MMFHHRAGTAESRAFGRKASGEVAWGALRQRKSRKRVASMMHEPYGKCWSQGGA